MKILHAVVSVLAMAPSVVSTGIKMKECHGDACDLDESDMDDFLDADFIDIDMDGLGIKGSFKHVVTKRPNQRKLTEAQGGQRAWYGVNGDSAMNLVEEITENGQKEVFGTIQDSKAVHFISPDANGKPIVTTKLIEDFKPEAPPPKKRTGSVRKRGYTLKKPENRELSVEANRELTVESKVIDLMVVWTVKTECRKSGLGDSCVRTDQTRRNMMGLIDLAIAETNTAYDLSGIDAELRLVHAYCDTTYREPTSGDAFGDALEAITEQTDGVMDDVHRIRDEKGADMVVFLIHDDDYCGMAWLGEPPEKDYCFAVVAWECATGYYSFGHEIGHNMGCNHDRGTSRDCSSSVGNYGFRDPDATFRTIMAYNCHSGQCDGNKGGSCPRIQRFSNRIYTHNGKVMGNAQYDNASQINSVVMQISAFYDSKWVKPTLPTSVPPAQPKSPPGNPQSIILPGSKCGNDLTWHFVTKKLKVKNCNWVGKKSKQRCRKRSPVTGIRAQDACRQHCAAECQSSV